jgi:putative DNA primase/helicase
VRLSGPPVIAWRRANLEQLLAEAVHRVDAGERFYPSREEEARLFRPQQQERTVESSREGAIRAYLYDENQKHSLAHPNGTLLNEISLTDLLTRVGYTIDKQTDAVSRRAGQLMNAMGWETRRPAKDADGKRPRMYVRPKKKTDDAAAPSARATPPTGRADGQHDAEDPDAPPF